MSKNSLIHCILFSLALVAVGCDRFDTDVNLPDVNDENCKPANANRIRNKDARNKFIDMCARSSTFEPSKPRGW
jgi:entry exclusion lipoprotein TrbK